MKHFLLLPFLFVAIKGFSQDSDTTSKLIAENEYTERKIAPRAAETTANLHKVAESELLSSLTHASAEKKVDIVLELVDRKSAKLAEVFQNLLLSNESVKLKMGVIEYESSPASELYTAVARQKEKAERKKYYQRTTSTGLQNELSGLFGRDYDTKWNVAETDIFLAKLTALALANNNTPAQTLSAIFHNNQYREKNHARVRYFAERHATPEILATLARFKKPADIALLKQNIDKAYLAISMNPNPSFFAILKAKSGQEFENPDFQNAVSAFRSAESKALLVDICKKITAENPDKTQRQDKLFSLYGIIEKNYCTLYTGVLRTIDMHLK